MRWSIPPTVPSSTQLPTPGPLRTGTVGSAFYLSPGAPFGGWGISSVGVEHGIEGFREYLRVKTIAYPYE